MKSKTREAAMSLKRLILLLVVLGSIAAVVVGLAAGSGGDGKRVPEGTRQGHGNRAPKATNQDPVKRSRPSKPDTAEKYWTPDRMKHAKPLPIGIPGGKQRGGSGEGGGSTAPSHP